MPLEEIYNDQHKYAADMSLIFPLDLVHHQYLAFTVTLDADI